MINKKNSFGYSPLDIAGLYCNKHIINLLKSKGAIDDGGVDYWAIRGANMQNWSGNVPENKK
jgi:ankyrin repeat protein